MKGKCAPLCQSVFTACSMKLLSGWLGALTRGLWVSCGLGVSTHRAELVIYVHS